jgi:hypothetical protein
MEPSMNAETYPISAIFAGDIYCPIGSAVVEVIGLQDVLISPQPYVDGASLTYVASNNDLEWLPDVDIFNEGNTFFVSLGAGDVLVFDGAYWTNAPLPSGGPGLGGSFGIDDGTFLSPSSDFTFDDGAF